MSEGGPPLDSRFRGNDCRKKGKGQQNLSEERDVSTMTNSVKAPLEGIRVLDLGRYQAGPRCALMFARMGAEVIKVETLRGDESRANGPTVRGQSAYWVQYNSGKKSLSINLRRTRARR